MQLVEQADPVTTEIVRHGLGSAADQIKRTLIRTAMTPIIYDVLDFAAAIYDDRCRMLAQAPSIPLFMGTMSFCVEAAVRRVGGPDALEPGDAILINDPYETGSHPQDAAVVMPIFMPDGTLVGYAAVKAHWMDIGAKAPYCTDTTDVHQEGTIFPGIHVMRRGVMQDDVVRIAQANSRMPGFVLGDLNAQISAVQVGAAATARLVARYGLDRFRACVERMYDHGEAVVRRYVERIPDGRYVGRGELDDDGISGVPIPFHVTLEVEGSSVRFDFSDCPGVQTGPVNCPIASTVSAARVALTMLAGNGEAPTEGHFRPIEVVARPGSMFHARPPAPCFLYGWPAIQACDAVLRALADAVPELVPAGSGGDICGVGFWGVDQRSGEFWSDASPYPIGQGASVGSDGSSGLLHFAEAATRFTPAEVREVRFPVVQERLELATDSAGAGRRRGGLGLDIGFRLLQDAELISTLDRTKNAPQGLAGGHDARPNGATVAFPDGRVEPVTKVTGLPVPAGTVLSLLTGGGAGCGEPRERDASAVLADVREGYVSEAAARRDYPHAFG
ncbi:hydantoinase B/oxoprolinase family protein [Conexibacter woesei]|uniref:5-oxoprolinase (ATP-hydrolyzing) n=1 Tax=Conexibacter woesei (strain DSM 14684 / CCUG 47730 / CIP 108061 / JCM 11494 / NBRC 100937 / ID131577) TaxID=469383 RepID=D3F5G5_CONWI|nr:hydantoinase B/oxoprolinase family protein [Conexibacter woesei]ADB50632.1 5-oxoprolinase (ATP-hydrolyzing) [Conexibacter woesei DSM 14684]